MAQDLNELRKLLAELNTLRVQFNKNPLGEEGLGRATKSMSAMNRQIEDFKRQLLDLDNGFGGIEESIKNIVREWKPGFADPTAEATKSFTKLKSIASKLSDDINEISVLSEKQLKDTKAQIEAQITKIAKIQKELSAKKKLSTAEQTILDNLTSEFKVQEELLKQTESRLKTEQKINKAMGLTGAAFKGIKGALGKIGIEGKYFDDVEEKMREAAKSGSKMKTAFVGIKGLAQGIGRALSDPLVVLGLLVKAAKFLYESLTFAKNESLAVAKATSGMLSKGFMQSLTNASNGMTLMFEDSLKATDELRKSLGFIPSQIGRSAKEGKALVNEIHTLTEAFGLSGQEASNVYSILQSSDIPVENIYKELDKAAVEFERSSGYAVDTQAAMKILSSSSAIVRNNMRGNAQELIKSANNAALMRMSLDDIRNAAESTLDFQGSIRKEMEAEMFLQKDLNLDAYRFAAATGDTTGQTKELQRLIRQNYKGLKNNTFAQQSFADALGISREQLAESIDSIELQNKLGAVTNDQVKYYNQLLAQGVSEEEAKAQIQKMGAEGVRKAFEEQQNQANRIARIQERFKQAVAGIAESLEPIIGKISDFLTSPAGKTFAKIAGLVAGGALVITAGKSLVNLFAGGLFKRGNNPTKPLFAHVVNQGTGTTTDVGKTFFKGNLFKYLGKNGGLSRTLNRTLIKVFGRNGFTKFMQTKVFNPSTLKKTADGYKVVNRGTTMLGRGLNKLFGKIIPQSGTNLQKAFGTNNKTTSLFSKLGPTLTKTLKVLGPVGVAADAIFGGIKGFKQSQMSAEEQKAAGVKEGIGKTESTIQGILTGGAEEGSIFSKYLGIEKGSAGDEAMGIAAAAGRGALIGSFFGPIGAAVGAGVGGLAETFKVFSDPNSSLRKGLDAGLAGISNTVSEGWDYATESLGEGIDRLSEKASQAGEWISETADSIWKGTKDIASSAISSIGSGLSSAADWVSSWFAMGGIAPGGFQAFASGGTVTKPTIGMVGEGRYNEAIVPLPDGKSIPVQMASGGNNETVTLLKELIAVVRQGGDIIIDGKKVGEAIAMTTSRMG